jgi:hypothetical protein
MRHRRLGYANVTATLALVLAMSGGAFAAGHYLINSTKQINPKVLRKLHGARGKRGVAGQNGPVGPQGVTGATGARGGRGPQGEPGFSALSQLPGGKSESGDFALSAPAANVAETLSTGVTFSVPLTAALPAFEFVVAGGGGEHTHCVSPGSAAKGYLCVYATSETNVETGNAFNPEGAATQGSGKFGAGLSWKAEVAGPAAVSGTYTLTAP